MNDFGPKPIRCACRSICRCRRRAATGVTLEWEIRRIVQSAALKATRLSLLTEQLLDGKPLSEGSDHHALAWLNSLRLDLQALGLERKGPASIDLHEYLKTQTEATAA
jgi:hypothetical protein